MLLTPGQEPQADVRLFQFEHRFVNVRGTADGFGLHGALGLLLQFIDALDAGLEFTGEAGGSGFGRFFQRAFSDLLNFIGTPERYAWNLPFSRLLFADFKRLDSELLGNVHGCEIGFV